MALQGAKTEMDPSQINTRILFYHYEGVLDKMRTGFLQMTSSFPASIPVPSQNTSKKKGNVGQPLIKFHWGIVLEEKDCLSTKKLRTKNQNYFQKYHLGVSAIHIIYSSCFPVDDNLYVKHCDELFRKCLLKLITFLLCMTLFVYSMDLIQRLMIV